MKSKIIFILLYFLIGFSAVSMAVEVAPRISDREIIEKLSTLESGQTAFNQRLTELREEMKSGDAALREEIKSGDAALREEIKSGDAALREEIKSGDAALREEIKSGDAALREEMKFGYAALNTRMDDMFHTMLALFTAVIALIVALFAYIAWDRRTMLKPVVDRLDSLERDVDRDLDLRHAEGSLLSRQLKVLRTYAKSNPEFAEIMRSNFLL